MRNYGIDRLREDPYNVVLAEGVVLDVFSGVLPRKVIAGLSELELAETALGVSYPNQVVHVTDQRMLLEFLRFQRDVLCALPGAAESDPTIRRAMISAGIPFDTTHSVGVWYVNGLTSSSPNAVVRHQFTGLRKAAHVAHVEPILMNGMEASEEALEKIIELSK